MSQIFGNQPISEEGISAFSKEESTYDQWCTSAVDRLVVEEIQKNNTIQD